MNQISRYSEDHYATKQDIYDELKDGVAAIVWEEVQAYRKQFAYAIVGFDRSYELILCRRVCFVLLHCEERLFAYEKHHKQHKNTAEYDSIEHEYELMDNRIQWCLNSMHRLHVDDIKGMYIMDMEAPLLIKTFLCLLFPYDEAKHLCYILLVDNQHSAWHDLICDVMLHFDMNLIEQDLTYAFLAYLQLLELKISAGMVLLKGNKKRQPLRQSVEQLRLYYPQCSKEQIQFYITHRQSGCYYTIHHYIESTGVCYETARYSLEELVKLKWYNKRRLGKKYVYYIPS